MARRQEQSSPRISSSAAKSLVLGVTLFLLAVLTWLSWGKWLTMFTVTSGPAVMVVAWLLWGRMFSSWALVPALLQAAYDVSWLWSFAHYAAPDPRTYDIFLFYVDGSFGFEPSIVVRHAIDQVPLLHHFFFYNYSFLPVAMAIAYAAHMRAKKRLLYIPVLFGVAIAGTLLYMVMPACGPASLLGTAKFAGDCGPLCADIRSIVPDVESFSFPPGDPRNCMPSLHVTWALLVYWICRDLKWGKWLAAMFLLCTMISTLFTGEHYLVDLVVAFPFSLAVWHLCVGEVRRTDPRRLIPIVGGLALTLVWIATLRSNPSVFWISPAVPWVASVATMGYALWAVSEHPEMMIGRSKSPTLSRTARQG